MNVSFIGSGNLAWHLGPALDNSGYVVKEVYSPHKKHAEAFTERLYQAEIKDSLDFSDSDSGLFIIAASDDSIKEIATEIILPENAILAHTSGSQPLAMLDFAATQQTGVFYPLQTFSKNKKVDFSTVPLFIESLDEQTERTLIAVGKAISKQVRKISAEERTALHVGAVFASNFTNHMLTLSKKILLDNHLNFDLLRPLITETFNKSLQIGPEKAQTGPAVRSDLEVLDRHLEFLNRDEKLAEIYRVISQHILDEYESD